MTRSRVNAMRHFCTGALAAWLLLGAPLAHGDEAPATGTLQVPVSVIRLRLPASDAVTVHGVLSHDTATGQPGAMLYPGGAGAAGFLAAVLTHGAIMSSVRSHERDKRVEAADHVLDPYRTVISHWSNADLIRSADEGLETSAHWEVVPANVKLESATEPEWLLDAAPQFLLTQDKRAMIIDNHVVIRDRKAPPKAAALVDATFRVVSDPLPPETETPDAPWLADEGAPLHQQAVALLRESLRLALRSAAGPPAATAAESRTWRYFEGGAEVIERAQLLEETPTRRVLKTLRAWVLSVPREPDPPAPASGE